MKFNSMLLITICLLQALSSSTDGFNEQTFIDATSKIIKYAKIYHEEWMKLEDKESLYDLKMYCAPLTSDNIRIIFEENGNLNLAFVNLNLVVVGKYKYGIGFSNVVNDFSASFNNFFWNIIYEVSKEELEDGKLDVKFKMIAASSLIYDVFLLSHKEVEIEGQNISPSIEDGLKGLMKRDFGYFPLTNQLKKIAELILVTVKSDLK